MTSRANKIVATEYTEAGLYCTQMGDGLWSVYTGPNGTGRELSNDHKTLRAARKWAMENPTKE